MGRPAIDLTYSRFGRLVVVRRAESIKYARWFCQCDCGGSIVVRSDFLRNGLTSSCGCLRRENARKQGAKYRGGKRIEKCAERAMYTFAALAECMP